ncbi:MAG: hypothetical protein M1813_009234 [Trichoglossum hirsutum]|nr:MAG: hypothetical protein M1813_009234 [Trichoglossum hirsutum]
MPTDKECANWNNEVSGRWFGYEELSNRLKLEWPDKADRVEFYNWLKRDEGKDRFGALVSLEALKDAISNTTPNDMDSRKRLWDLLALRPVPCFPAGKDSRGNIYRISPDGGRLRPDDETYPDDCIGYGILGITFSPEGSSSKDGDDCRGSADTQREGFVFHEIGTLELWCGDPEKFKDDDSDDPEKYDGGRGWWEPTSYCVVMKFDESGVSSGFYVVFDFFSDHEFETKINISDPKNLPDRGLIKDVYGRLLTAAKIADNIEELKFTHEFDLAEPLHDSFNLVTVVETSGGSWTDEDD